MTKWKKNPGYPNELLSCSEFFVSFNPSPGQKFVEFASDNGSSETTLKLNNKWYILNGDFRKEYEAAFPDPIACFKIYDDNKAKHRSSWSTDDEDSLEDLVNFIMQRAK